MTDRIQDFLRARRIEGNDVEPCLVVDLDVVRDNYQTFAKALPDTPRVLRGEGEPCAGSAVAAGLARLVLRLRVGRRDRDGARRRRDAGPHLLSATRSRRSATSRAPTRSASACSRSIAPPRSRRSRAPPPARRCSAASSTIAPAPNGRCRGSSAAIRRWRSTCSISPSVSASSRMAFRSMSARSSAR